MPDKTKNKIHDFIKAVTFYSDNNSLVGTFTVLLVAILMMLLIKCLMPDCDTLTLFFYFICIILSVMFSFFYEKSSNSFVKTLLLITIIAIPSFMVGCRNLTAIDDPVYQNMFQNEAFMFDTSVEFGFVLFSSVLSLFCSYKVFQLICAILTFSLIMLSFHKMSRKICLPIATLFLYSSVYFLYLSTGLIRIFLASAIVLYGTDSLIKKKPTRFIIYVLIAATIHRTALFMLLFLPFCFRDSLHIKNISSFIWIYLFFIPVFLFLSHLLAINIFSRWENAEINETQIGITLLAYIFFLLIIIFTINKCNKKNKEILVACALMIITILFIRIKIFKDLGRLEYYLFYALPIGLSIVYKNSKNDLNKTCIAAAVVAFVFLYIYCTEFNPCLDTYPHLFPYENFFFILE